MRFVSMRFIAAAMFVLLAGSASAQEFAEYVNKVDRFTLNAPGQPTVQDITWPSEYGAVFPGRVYTWVAGASRYSMTVIDYTDAERIHAERKNHTEADSLPIYWQVDIQASIAYAATKFRQRPGVKVTFDAYHYINLISGHQLQLTNPDQSRTFVGIYLHENRLYIVEATVPPRAPQPGLFQQSVGFLDEMGNQVRYQQIYFNRLPTPRLGRGGRGGRGGAPQQ
jgi:hypothetical protein